MTNARTLSHRLLRACASLAALVLLAGPAKAQLAVIDPLNLIQTALSAARALEQIDNQVTQITNQVKALENDARNLARLGQSYSPELVSRLKEMDQLVDEAKGVALSLRDTREALQTLYTGDYRNSDIAERARAAAQQIDNARFGLQRALLMQAEASDQLRQDETTLAALGAASQNASGALSAQQAGNELLAFEAEQSMRLEALLLADNRAEALARARDMEVRAEARAQHDHFFSTATSAYPGPRPWN
ncbi:MAG: P-type conjugative transfer protein TrbJ [Alphaproteobacteria bacterium]|nr:P-type conjugative transfer protein TrbJ [Alphaproteobacteria bacterium]